jgi:hypothetical protein
MNFYNRKNKPVMFVASLLFLFATTISTVYAQDWLDRAQDRADDRYNDRQERLDRAEDPLDEELDRIEEDNEAPAENENNEAPAEKTAESDSEAESDDKCTVDQVLKMKDSGLSDNQIQKACE